MKHKIIILHIPKTAGSTVSNYFKEFEDFDVLWGIDEETHIDYAHLTVSQIEEKYKYLDLHTYTWYVFIRNPYDRAYSAYIYLTKGLELKCSFENFLKSLTSNPTKYLHASPIVNFVNLQHLDKYNFVIFSVENFDKDFVSLLELLNLPQTWENCNVNSDHFVPFKYKVVYEENPKLYGLVSYLYKDDLTLTSLYGNDAHYL